MCTSVFVFKETPECCRFHCGVLLMCFYARYSGDLLGCLQSQHNNFSIVYVQLDLSFLLSGAQSTWFPLFPKLSNGFFHILNYSAWFTAPCEAVMPCTICPVASTIPGFF